MMNIGDYKIKKILKRGGKSQLVYLLENNNSLIIKKKYNPEIKEHREHFYNELRILRHLQDCPFVPKILKVSPRKCKIFMTYCGENPSIGQLRKIEIIKIKRQVRRLMKILYKEWGVYRSVNGRKTYSINFNNICILENKIYLIDFGSLLWNILF